MALKLETKPKPQTFIIEEEKAQDLVIIGGGPAGLTAAIYACRSRLNTILVEKMVLGGLASTAYHIENFPGFPDGIAGMALAEKMSEQAKRAGVKVLWGNAVEIKNGKQYREIKIDGKKLQAKAVVIATGTEKLKLNIPGEEKFIGRGVSYCATCDGAFYQNKNVMVVGGGNAAIEEALE